MLKNDVVWKVFLFIYLFSFLCFVNATTIYDIQYTTDAGDGTYPSPMDGQNVTVTGIVTATDYYSSGNSNRFFMTDPVGGPWHGIFVFNWDYDVELGDEVTVAGSVIDYFGLTELNVSTLTIESSGNYIPPPIIVSTGDLVNSSTAEQYEGCLVKVIDVSVTNLPDNYGQWYVTDGSGECQIDDAIFEYSPTSNETFTNIIGAVDYSYDEFGISPRAASDFNYVGGSPLLTNIHTIPDFPKNGDSFQIRASVTKEMPDDADIDSVLCFYRTNENDDLIEVSMDLIDTQNTYEFIIAPQSTGTEVQYKIYASNVNGLNVESNLFTVQISPKKLYLDVPKKPFVPKIGETFEITYQVIEECELIMNIYSIDGKLITTIKDEVVQPGDSYSYIWDGKDEYLETLEIGTYILQVEAITDGKSTFQEKPIVIGTILK